MKRRELIRKKCEQGKSIDEIAEELQLPKKLIEIDIEAIKESIQERRDIVKKLYNQGKLIKEIAKVLNVCEGTISRDIRYLKEQEEIGKSKQETRGEYIQERRNKVKELYRQNKIAKQIAQELDVCPTTVHNDRKYLKTEGEKYILNCKNRFAQKTLKEENILTLQDATMLIGNYEDSVFYLKMCMMFGKIGQAMNFINCQITNKAFSKEQRDKMEKLREQIQETEKKYIAIQTIKRGEGIIKAARYSGLSKEEAIELNRNILQNGKRRKRTK